MNPEVVTVGLGYIGLPTSALIASNGTHVLGVDTNQKVVNTIKRIDIPSTPNLNLMKSFIQDFSSINWKFAVLWSKEYQRNKESKKVATLPKREI